MYFTIAFRTVFLYFLIVIYYRIMGKKEVGELGIIDLIVSFSVAELASICIEEPNKSIWTSIIPITLLVIIEIVMSYISMKSGKFRKLIDGSPSIVIKNGKVNKSIMAKLRYTLDDLLTQLREKDIKSLDEVKYAVLETDGKLSIFEDNIYPLPLICDGVIDYETLKNINKSSTWLYNMLNNKHIDIDDVYYAFYKNNTTYIITKDDLL